jgi:hypothetical protein
MKSNLNYCIVLSSEQLTYLSESKYGIDRMKILHRLIEKAVLKETKYAIKGFSVTRASSRRLRLIIFLAFLLFSSLVLLSIFFFMFYYTFISGL